MGTWILVFNCDLKGCIDYFRQQNILHLGSLMCFHNSLFHCIFIESEVTIYDFLVTLVEFFAIYSDCWTVAKSAPDRVCWSKCTFFAQVFCEAGCLDWRWPVVTSYPGHTSKRWPGQWPQMSPLFCYQLLPGLGGADSPMSVTLHTPHAPYRFPDNCFIFYPWNEIPYL